MILRKSSVTVAALTIGAAWAQPASQQARIANLKTFASSSEVQTLIANAKKTRKTEPLISQSLLQLAPYKASLEYRPAVGSAAVHEKEAEFFYVVEGSGTLTTGGRLVNEKRTNAENLTGTGIAGGASQALSQGDFAIVPENTPHWFSEINGTLVLVSLHVPRP